MSKIEENDKQINDKHNFETKVSTELFNKQINNLINKSVNKLYIECDNTLDGVIDFDKITVPDFSVEPDKRDNGIHILKLERIK